MTKVLLILLIVGLVLVACGGGGDNNTATQTATPETATSVAQPAQTPGPPTEYPMAPTADAVRTPDSPITQTNTQTSPALGVTPHPDAPTPIPVHPPEK